MSTGFYDLRDQVRDMALGYADIHNTQKARPRALCEFDGEKWTPIEMVNEVQLDQVTPQLRQLSVYGPTDSAYGSTGSTANSSVGRVSPEGPSYTTDNISPMQDEMHAQSYVSHSFRRSSAFKLPELDVEQYQPDGPTTIDERPENEDVLRDMIVQEHVAKDSGGRRPSILASPAYQQNLIQFADLAVSEVDLSEEAEECNLALARQHIISAFPKQFEAEATSPQPLIQFSVYSQSEEPVEMLHVVLVLESRTVFWKSLGASTKPVDKVTTLPYCWDADLDLPPLTLDEPRATNEVECLIMDRAVYSTIPCDNHNDECRRCKGLASEDECFACEGTGIFKKKACVMCSGNGKYFCKNCKNTCHSPCVNCGSSNGPKPVLRQAYITCTRETVVSPTMEVEGDNKASLVTTAKTLARQTIEAENFAEGTLPVAACGVLIRQKGHVICATDLKSGARGLFEVVPELDRVEFKGQLSPVTRNTSRPSSIHSNSSVKSNGSKRSWFKKKQKEADADDGASIRSTASSRLKSIFSRK